MKLLDDMFFLNVHTGELHIGLNVIASRARPLKALRCVRGRFVKKVQSSFNAPFYLNNLSATGSV